MFKSEFYVTYSKGFNITNVTYKGVKYYLNQYDFFRFKKVVKNDEKCLEYVKHYLKNNDNDILKRIIKELE